MANPPEKRPSDRPQQRLTVYVNKEDYAKLRAEFDAKGITVSGWIRARMREYLHGPPLT